MESEKTTPLLDLLRAIPVKEQHRLAKEAGTTRNYLYQLATCERGTQISAIKAVRISEAIAQLHARSMGRLPKISVKELATMCLVND